MSEPDYKRFARDAKKDGWNLDDPAEAVALAAFIVGPSIKRIARFLGKPYDWCVEPARRLRENGCWSGGHVVIDGDEVDGFVLAMQSLVASGMLERVSA